LSRQTAAVAWRCVNIKTILMRSRLVWILLSALLGATLAPALDAADFVFYWKAASDPFVTAYGVYQRMGDAPYQRIDVIRTADLNDPAHPSYRVTGLNEGNTYWFAASGISASNVESDLSGQTCVTVNGQAVECSDDDDESGAAIIVSCFISAAGGRISQRPAGR
jgi:hypothetical protein